MGGKRSYRVSQTERFMTLVLGLVGLGIDAFSFLTLFQGSNYFGRLAFIAVFVLLALLSLVSLTLAIISAVGLIGGTVWSARNKKGFRKRSTYN